MKRTFAAVITAVTASTSIWLAASASASADAASVAWLAHAKPGPTPAPSAALHVVPKWTYQHGGKLAVIATCSERRDLRVINSNMLRYPLILRKGGNLLIKVANKTNPGKYTITLWCVNSHHLTDAMDVRQVKIYKRLGRFRQPTPPGLPKHFKANVIVTAGPPAPAPNPHGKNKRH
jgi:hypothetical protein